MKREIFVEEQVLIKSDITTVWNLLTDWSGYPQWNPFIVKVDCSKDNKKMKFHLIWDNGKKGSSKEEFVSARPPEKGEALFVYKYASILAKLGLLRATRVHKLEQRGIETFYYTKEEFTGPLACFVPINDVRKGFKGQTDALASASVK